jgi:tetratricopeptide (TPR) repeat protein
MAKMTRKELLNAPDEFVTTTSTIVKLIKENPLRLASIAAIIVILITSGIGFYYWKTNRERSAMIAYNNAYDNSQLTLQVMQNYADTKAGKLSKLRLAVLAYKQNEYSMALDHAQEFINGWGHEDIFYWDGILVMAASYMEQQTTDKALPLLNDCVENAPEHIRDQALFYKAQALLGIGKKEEAREALITISDKNQDIAKISLAQLENNTRETTDAEQ